MKKAASNNGMTAPDLSVKLGKVTFKTPYSLQAGPSGMAPKRNSGATSNN